ncbi:hypothetical protein DLAC_06620 [Tieghemostelium lacteum]|uniref:Transmembrane protein n=1 Tax=Tieghemostelium lacteum TaxID=361077 RepID=A0A151ZFI2_TIELA|nr:hypothetical protein DLAC_06620 [Tieghemostelium lacteum]|eukprot:KYQ92624.1 hypothetical protein DLAC_06620 [Tieghemostelium lacteum]
MVDNKYEIQDQAFVVTLVINVVITLVGLILFSFLRRKYQSFYHYRYTSKQPGVDSDPPIGFFSWIFDTLRHDNDKILSTNGLDGYMYLKSLKTFFLISLVLMVLSSVMLYPTNYYGTYNESKDEEDPPVSGLSLISMQNIARGSSLMWVHLSFGFLLTGIVLYFLIKDFHEYAQRRIIFKQQHRVMNYAVFIRDIPKNLYTRESLAEYFDNYFPNQIKYLFLYYTHGGPLYKLIAEREQFVKKYEKAVFKYHKTNQRPLIRSFLCCGASKDAINTYSVKIDQLTREIDEKRSILEREQEKPSTQGGNGLVVFHQRQTAKTVTQSVMHREFPFKFSRYQAPDPLDVEFKNASNVGMKSYYIRTILVSLFIFGLVFFWSIPVVFLSGFSNLATLSSISAFSWIVDIIELSPVLTGFLQGFLPNLVLIIFMALLIPIITAVSRAQGFFSQSSIDRSVLRKYFLFLVFNVFLVYAIAGSVLGSIKTIVDHPADIVPMLAESLSALGFQFINYVMIAAVASFLGIGRFIGLLIRNLKLRYLSKTKREIRATMHCGSPSYGVSSAKNLLILQICLAFSTLAPFIMVFGAIYFAGTYLVSKYNLIWVQTPAYQSGGQFYPSLFRRSIVGILIYQVLMIGSFNIYKFFYGILLVIPLVFTLIIWAISEYNFTRLSENGILDINISNSAEEEEIFIKGNDYHDSSISTSQYTDQYRQPYDRPLILPEEEIEVEPGYPNI